MSGQTYADLLKNGAAELIAANIDEAHYQAKLLLLHCTGWVASELISKETGVASEKTATRFNQAIAQRVSGVPVQHIIGTTEFFGLTLKTDLRALIPRPDSEIVAELALSLIPPETVFRLADLGTGSGALLAALLATRPKARGIAIEASQNALTLAAENFRQLDMADRAQLFLGSWTDWTGWDQCDLIISNPPYIRSDVISTLAPEVRDHDPLDALDGGVDGLDAYREIIALGAHYMKPGAHLVLEIGYDQKDPVSDLLIKAGFVNLQHRQDLGGNDRAIAATKT